MKQKIFLVGLPGTGKTTIGQKLAHSLELPFIDLDQKIEQVESQSIRSIFATKGEDIFREVEHQMLKKVIDDEGSFVLATGGGTPCFFNNMELINASGTSIFIDTPIDEIKQRLQQDSVRPLMQTNTLESLHEKRINWYKQAHHSIRYEEELSDIFKF